MKSNKTNAALAYARDKANSSLNWIHGGDDHEAMCDILSDAFVAGAHWMEEQLKTTDLCKS